jgi:signal transduction histidine kinase
MTLEYKRHRDFPLHLPPSIFEQASEIARREKLSLNHFIGLAIAEKISRLDQGEIWASNKELSRLVSSLSRPKSADATDPQDKH